MPEGIGHIDYPLGSSDYPKHLGKRVGRRGVEERWPQEAIETLPAEGEVAEDLVDERRGVVRNEEKEDIEVDETVRRALENLPSLEKVVGSVKNRGILRSGRSIEIGRAGSGGERALSKSGVQFSQERIGIHPLGNKERGKFTKKEERDYRSRRKVGAMTANTDRQSGLNAKSFWEERQERERREKETKQKYFEEWLNKLNKKIEAGKFGTKVEEKVAKELDRAKKLFSDIYESYYIKFDADANEVIYKKRKDYQEERIAA